MEQEIVIRGGSIRLGQLLKLTGLAETGGEAKQRIQAGEVMVNGLVETRRGRQLLPGDRVELAGRLLTLRSGPD